MFQVHSIKQLVWQTLISGTIATYFRMIPSIKKRYDYGVMIFILTFNLVLVSGVRAEQEVWKIARDRLLTIVIGFIICICVSLFVFPLWASDELHDSTVSRFQELANTIQGILHTVPDTEKVSLFCSQFFFFL